MITPIIFDEVQLDDSRYVNNVTLKDYDYETYTMSAVLPIKNRLISFKATYAITDDVEISLIEEINSSSIEYQFNIPSTLFFKYLTKYLEQHISDLKNYETFYGQQIMSDFINECIKYTQEHSITINKKVTTITKFNS